MDYGTVCQIVADQAAQILNQQNISARIESEVKQQVDLIVKGLVEEQFTEIKENIILLNQQILILKDIIETISTKHNQ